MQQGKQTKHTNDTTAWTRRATHAGSWYSSNREELADELDGWLAAVRDKDKDEDNDKDNDKDQHHQDKSKTKDKTKDQTKARAAIAPHAGYTYSGSTAAHVYAAIDTSSIKTVFVLGPSHHEYLPNVCSTTAAAVYSTPLGPLPIDTRTTAALTSSSSGSGSPLFSTMSRSTDEREHSIELHLPYLKHLFAHNPDLRIVPILVGALDYQAEKRYGAALAPYLADKHSFFVVSSDFCHWGSRFHYTYYNGSSLNPSDPAPSPPQPPIYKAIDSLDHDAMHAIALPNPATAHRSFNDYLKRTKNTICGRHPIGLLLAALANHVAATQDAPTIKWLHYAQSSQITTPDDSSVSYVSGLVEF